MGLKAKSIKAAPVGKIGQYTLDYACEHGIGFYYTPDEPDEAPTPNDMTDELSSVVDYLDKSIRLMDLYGFFFQKITTLSAHHLLAHLIDSASRWNT